MNQAPTTAGRKTRWPWWASVLLAAVCYATLKYLLPQCQPAHPALAGLVRAAPFFAPIVAIPLLLLAAKQLYDTGGEDNDQRGDHDGHEG